MLALVPLLAAVAAAPLREHQTPHLAACDAESAAQQWHIETSSPGVSAVRLGGSAAAASPTCLCSYSAHASDNPALGEHELFAAVLLPCDTPESNDTTCEWLVTYSGNQTLSFAAKPPDQLRLPVGASPPSALLGQCGGSSGTATALDWYGKSLGDVLHTKSDADCCEACASHSGCRYWTRANSTRSGGAVGRCFLKSSATGRRTNNPGYVAGRMPGAPLPPNGPPARPPAPPPPSRPPAGMRCLAVVQHVWPVPAWRNSVVQLGPSCTEWTIQGTMLGAPGASVCLDGGSGPATAPPPPRCCSNATAKEKPYCDASLPFGSRATDLVQRLSVEEIAGVLTMGMPGSETRVGTTYINQRLTTPVERLSVPGFEFSEACHGILSGCLAPSAHSSGCPTSFPMPIGQAASFSEYCLFSVSSGANCHLAVPRHLSHTALILLQMRRYGM